ncbi:uncharacterized protein B0H18DRAFT_1117520 [Fomitopsis serialis]|uniref:uncharacterized protein n=1 Tax=Fomitopsis serialis TaxID=139415 RepID=UPI0020079EF4|nr:uncharacterized protein B0H18DRAFT_1117520 [Neoantrodia serialis]KAH9929155.1 hypothetical protein B0H18DRAFT_1117520 [Neoantrodia serialis]
MVPPSRFISANPIAPTKHAYLYVLSLWVLYDISHIYCKSSLRPTCIEYKTRCFVWNLHEDLIKPAAVFARTFCADLDIPTNPWADTAAAQIRAQLEEHAGVAELDLEVETDDDDELMEGDEVPECRVVLSIDVQIANHHLSDHIEWDLLSSLTPEQFASTLCAELGLSGEAVPLVAHAVHEELIKHKRDAWEWGVLGLEQQHGADEDRPRDRSGFSLLKDKTGLGLSWGRAPKDGRGPKPLRSVWRDWQEAEEFRTRFEVLTAEEVERREIERERASRRLRETSKFQSSSSM